MGTSAVKHTVLDKNDLAAWAQCIKRLAKVGGEEIYFEPSYISLYQHAQTEIEAFVYEEGESLFFLPYLKNSVPLEYADSPSFDIESAYGYGGPLSTITDKDFLKRAWQGFFEYAHSTKIIAGFLRFHSFLKNERLAQAAAVPGLQFSNTVVTLTLNKDKEAVWKDYSENTRTRVRKAERLGVSVVTGESESLLKRFQNLYYTTMDQVNARQEYYFSDEYFSRIGSQLKGAFKVYVAQAEGEDIGGALILFSGDYVYYHLSANLKEYRRFEPATFLRHNVIMATLDSGKKAILFGGGRTSDPKDSLLTFKKGFSKETASFYIGKLIFDPKTYKSVCARWEKSNPHKVKSHETYFLKYKF